MSVKLIANGATLKKFQQILVDVWQLEKRINEIPALIETKRNTLREKKTRYLTGMEHIKKVNDYIKDNKIKLEELIKKREEAEEKLERVSTQREFDNENNIVENCKKEEHKRRINISNLEKRNELANTKVKDLENEISQIEATIDAETDELKNELDIKKKEYEEAVEKKEKAAQKIDQNLVYKFERIIRSKGGLATVGLKSGVCQGCHIQLPDQFVNTVRENKEIQFCPYCSRILVYEAGKDDMEIIESNNKYKDRISVGEEYSESDDEQEADVSDDLNEVDSGEISYDDSEISDDTADDVLTKENDIADESEFDL